MWKKPTQIFNLVTNDIHVWRANLDIDIATQNTYWQLLSEEEKTRANRFKFPHLKMRFIAARGILRQLLGRYLKQAPTRISFKYGAQGKPALSTISTLNFNISHSKNHAIFAFAKGLIIGVDVEYIDPTIDLKVIAPRFFSTSENTSLFALPKAQQTLGFFHCWTRKEAFIKAKGGGLSIPLDQFEVTLLPELPAKLLRIEWDMADVPNWSLYSFFSAADSVSALAVKGKVEKIAYFDWDLGG